MGNNIYSEEQFKNIISEIKERYGLSLDIDEDFEGQICLYTGLRSTETGYVPVNPEPLKELWLLFDKSLNMYYRMSKGFVGIDDGPTIFSDKNDAKKTLESLISCDDIVLVSYILG